MYIPDSQIKVLKKCKFRHFSYIFLPFLSSRQSAQPFFYMLQLEQGIALCLYHRLFPKHCIALMNTAVNALLFALFISVAEMSYYLKPKSTSKKFCVTYSQCIIALLNYFKG